MTRLRKFTLVSTVAFAVGAPAALATWPVSHAGFWQNQAHTATCGKRIKQPSFQLLCSAKGIPRPTTGHQGGDPFVVLARTGKPELVLLSQDEFPSGHPVTLVDGTAWSQNGVVCNVGHLVTCSNQSGHGFVIGNGKYRSF